MTPGREQPSSPPGGSWTVRTDPGRSGSARWTHTVPRPNRATPVLVGVLCRYPSAPTGKSRVAQLMATLDDSLRAQR